MPLLVQRRLLLKLGFLITISIASLSSYGDHLPDDYYTPNATCAGTAQTAEIAKKGAQTRCAGLYGGDQQAWNEHLEWSAQRPPFLRTMPQQPLTYFFGISNGQSGYEHSSLIMLIDYLQVAFRLEGGEEKLIHGLNVPLGNMAFQYEIPGLQAGLHNMLMILLAEAPEGEILEVPALAPWDSIYVGEGDPPLVSAARPPDSAFKEIGIPKPPDRAQLGGCELSPIPNPTQSQLGGELHAAPGQEVNYYIEIFIPDGLPPELSEAAVTVLLDQQQISLDGENLLEHLRLKSSQYIELPAKLIAPEKPGRHPLRVFVFMNPYQIHPHHGDNPKPTLFDVCTNGFKFDLVVEGGS